MIADNSGRRLRVGVIGLGAWGMEHVRAWRDIPGVELVAVCDRDAALASDVARSWSIENWYDSSRRLAQEAGLDVVSIVSDEASRLDAAIPLLEAGVHALIEKPIALDVQSAHQLVDAASKAGVLLMPSHPLRFDSRFAMLKERIEAGDLGSIRSIYCRRLIPRDRYQKYARAHPALMAGIHDFDLARWYFDAEPETVRAFGSRLPGEPLPDIMWTLLTFPNGGIAVIETAWVLPSASGLWLESETEVIGSNGLARINNPGNGIGLWLAAGVEQPDTTLAGSSLGRSWGALKDELSYLASCVDKGVEPNRVTSKDALDGLAVALAAIRSLEEGSTPQHLVRPEG